LIAEQLAWGPHADQARRKRGAEEEVPRHAHGREVVRQLLHHRADRW
jgi:hypothetical protein